MSLSRPFPRSGPPVAAVVLLVVALLQGCGGEPDLGPGVVARIGEREILYDDFESYLVEIAGDVDRLQGAAVAALFETFLEEQLLFSLAIDRGLVEPDSGRAGAAAALLAAEPDLVPAEGEITAAYEQDRERWNSPERVRLRQILVEKRELAQRAVEQLEAGEDWATVADRLEREHGALTGSQGLLSRLELPESFVEPIFALPEGAHTPILEAEYGYHIFFVEERRAAGVLPLETVRDDIARELRTRRSDAALRRLLEEASERYDVEVADQNLPFRRSDSDAPGPAAEG